MKNEIKEGVPIKFTTDSGQEGTYIINGNKITITTIITLDCNNYKMELPFSNIMNKIKKLKK